MPQQPPDPAVVLTTIRDASDVAKALDEYSPPHEAYKRLKAKLAELRGTTAEEEKIVRIPEGPLVRPGMLAAFFLIFLPALRELTVSVMLYGPTTRTIGVAIYTLNEDGETVYSAALAGIALIIIVVGETVIKRVFKIGRKG